MSGFDSPREWRDVLREEHGPLWGHAIFRLWILGGTALALTAIAGLLWFVYTKITVPVLSLIAKSGRSLPPGGYLALRRFDAHRRLCVQA